jgi:hypothetical protein
MCTLSDCCSLYPGYWVSCSDSGNCLFSNAQTSEQNYYCQSVTTTTTSSTSTSTTIPGTFTEITCPGINGDISCDFYPFPDGCTRNNQMVGPIIDFSVSGHGNPPSVNCDEKITLNIVCMAHSFLECQHQLIGHSSLIPI